MRETTRFRCGAWTLVVFTGFEPASGKRMNIYDQRVIYPCRPGLPFVNAGDIAAARYGDAAARMSYAAAEIAATTRTALIEARLDFCTETVLSHPPRST